MAHTRRDPRALLATVEDAAIALGLSKDQVRRLMRDGALGTRRIRTSVRIPWADIDAIASHAPVPAAAVGA